MSCNGCGFSNSSTDTVKDAYNWINDLPKSADESLIVEVKFKSTRREYYINNNQITLKRGDKIVVASTPGHDIGEVTLTGYLAEKQFKRKSKSTGLASLNGIYRIANENDFDKLKEAREREKPTMIRAREIANELALDMKIGDVEFRGDNKKAIFYYIAENRVDFRELIKRYAREFQIKIEMKQIGARQEAGIVGGIGSCGMQLCCSYWKNNFDSIPSEAATNQGLSPSSQKMSGACAKLKCCLLYELDTYIEARKEFPKDLLQLETVNGIAKPINTDYLKREIWFTVDSNKVNDVFKLSLQEIKDIIQKNKKGIKIDLSKRENTPLEFTSAVAKPIDKVIKKRRKKRRHKAENTPRKIVLKKNK